MIGHTISHYEILEKLGEGGMGVVHKAFDTHLERFVAIKVLPSERVSDPDRKRRFVLEAKAASALNHPNIVTIYEIGSVDSVDFIAMEFVSGRTLDYMHWYHITSMPSGEGFRVYATNESTDKELRARHINPACLLSFRGCDGLCELLPDAVPVLNDRHRGWGGCCSVPRSWCELKDDDCRLGFR